MELVTHRVHFTSLGSHVAYGVKPSSCLLTVHTVTQKKPQTPKGRESLGNRNREEDFAHGENGKSVWYLAKLCGLAASGIFKRLAASIP